MPECDIPVKVKVELVWNGLDCKERNKVDVELMIQKSQGTNLQLRR